MQKLKRNAIIMAAGTSSRFVPLSAEIPKGLLVVRGEILIERQIRQLKEAGIDDITIVTGYKAELFGYLGPKYNVHLVHNEDYYRYNNVSSIMCVLDRLNNTFICSSDNYFPNNVFVAESGQSFYSALFAAGSTDEYCLLIDENDYIRNVFVGGHDAWYMVGPAYFTTDFSDVFKKKLKTDYLLSSTKQEYWEDVYIRYINELPSMKIHRYNEHDIEEFDTIDDLRQFDSSYINDTRSSVLKAIADKLCCKESDLSKFKNSPNDGNYLLFSFKAGDTTYEYDGLLDIITKR